MATYSATIRRKPVVITVDAVPGTDDVLIQGTLDWNTTGTTVTVDLRLSNTLVDAAELTLTNGGGNLVVTPGTTTAFSFKVPRTFAGPTNAEQAFALLKITDASSNVRTWLTVVIKYTWSVTSG